MENVCLLSEANLRAITAPVDKAGQVLLLKLRGDRFMYKSRLVFSKDDMIEADKCAFQEYEKGMNVAADCLPVTTPLRLGFILNYAYWKLVTGELIDSKTCATEAYQKFFFELDNVSSEDLNDVWMIMILLYRISYAA